MATPSCSLSLPPTSYVVQVPTSADECPVCGGRREALKDSNGKPPSANLALCLPCEKSRAILPMPF